MPPLLPRPRVGFPGGVGLSRGAGHRARGAAAADLRLSKSGPCGGVVLAESRFALAPAAVGALGASRDSLRPSVSGDSALAGFPCLCSHLGAFRAMLQVLFVFFSISFNDLSCRLSPHPRPIRECRPLCLAGGLASRPRALDSARAASAGGRCGRSVVRRGMAGRRLRYFGRDSCNILRHVLGYGRVVVWTARPIRLARIGRSLSPPVRRGRSAWRCAPPPPGSSRRPNVYGWRRLAKALVTKDFSGFAPECAALGARVRALPDSRDTRGRMPA